MHVVIYSRVSSKSEANASELLENFEEMLLIVEKVAYWKEYYTSGLQNLWGQVIDGKSLQSFVRIS